MARPGRPLVPSRLAHGGGSSRSTGARAPAARRPRGRVAAYVALTKPRIIELLLITTVPTMVVAQQGLPSLGLVLATLVGGTLAAGGANAVNMYIDRDIDRVMHRTKGRPLATGELEPRRALLFALALEVVAFAVLYGFVNLLSAALALGAMLFYVFVYSLWLKRTSRQNIVIGGAAGAVPVLIGWSAVTDGLGWAPWVLFALMFFWTPPHFWALAIRYTDDYRAADVPMLPVVASLRHTASQILAYTVVVFALSLVFAPVADLGWIYLGTALAVGLLFTALAVDLRREPTAGRAMRLFTFSISYVTVLFLAMAVDVLVRHGW
ncbi:MAG: protoheme IX farnesyltransferase [Acidimicrobiales bacterium]|nr:protoheme IX farnesyltransferase [Acidimicrobiales bacterium]